MGQHHAKQRLQRQGRSLLGISTVGGLDRLFAAAAERLGVPWDGHKAHGYELLRQLIPVKPRATRAPKPAIVRPRLVKPPFSADVMSVEFLSTYEWRRLRMVVLTKRGAKCECCGQTPLDGVVMHVDHIKPRRLFPELALDENNLQILCEICNHGKGNWDQTDWRRKVSR